MLDFLFSDPRLLFPDITESFANLLEDISTAWFFIGFFLSVWGIRKVLKKMGVRWWKSIIPIYNTYILYSYSWGKKYFWIYFLSDVIFNLAENASTEFAQRFPNNPWLVLILLFAMPLGIVTAICDILFTIRLSEAFGKGKLFCIGLFLAYPIFIAILGFGRSRYIGPNGEAQTDAAKGKLIQNRR